MTMIKTRDLDGVALDWAVAKTFGQGTYWTSEEFLADWSPSTRWEQAGPIIEREKIMVAPDLHNTWRASQPFTADHYRHLHGPIPLVAAMRCYVYSKMGEEVDVPDELVGGKL